VVETSDLRLSVADSIPSLVISEIGDHLLLVNYLGMQLPPRSTQPCIPPKSLNRVPALAGVKVDK